MLTLGAWQLSAEDRADAARSEAETSKPLLYDRGWGKKQAYCFAVGASGAEDVTRAYVDGWDECLQRRRAKDLGGGPISEAYLAQVRS